jgi:PAS domain S-box-containing protein/putative nucleotidyltransferase with HDIG domain
MVTKGGVEPHLELFKSIIKGSLDAIVCADSEGSVVLWNPAAETMFGYSQAEAIGQPLTMILREEDRKAHLAGMAYFLKAEKPRSLIGKVTETWGLKKDGTTFRKDMSLSSEKVDGEWLFTAIMRDVTERKQAEEKASDMTRILEGSLDEIYLFDADTLKFIQVNRGARLNLGYEADELYKLTPLDIKPKFTHASFEKLIKPLRTGEKEKLQFTTTHRRKDGSLYPVEVHLQTSTFESKKVFAAIILDVTERKQAEEEIWQAKNELQQFFSIVPSLICIAGTDGYFKEVNHEWEKALGYSQEELLSKPFTDLIHPDDLEMTFKEVEKQLTGQSTTAFINRYRHKDGGYRWLEWHAAPASESNLLYAAANDITERVQAVKQLQGQLAVAEESRESMLYMLEDINESTAAIKQAKEEWEQTFDAVTDPIFLHDSEFRIMRANRAYAEEAGMEFGEMIGKPYWEVFPKGDGPMPGCQKVVGKEEKTAEEEISTEDGRVYLSRSYVIPAENSSHHASIHVMSNITEHRQAEQNLAHVNRALATLSMVNHELVHAQNEPELMQAICRAIVEQHGYHMAWVGYAQDDKNRSIKIVASAGAGQKVLDDIQPSWAENESGMGPSGRAVRSGKMQWTQDIATDQDYQEWGDALLKFGCVADVALPMMDSKNKVFGLLHVYAGDLNAFTDTEIGLLQEMADDLAYGVRSLRTSLHRDEVMAVNDKQLKLIRLNLQETISAVAKAVGARDAYTAGHQVRVAELAAAIAREMNLEEERIEGIRMGATIHDIGKINLPAEILSKPSKLTDIEYSLIKGHAQVGHDILKDVHFPWPVADIVFQHHERVDGSGYPQGLKGDEICLEARIVAVADVVEAMLSHRPYRASLGIDAALDEIREHRGSWFDEQAVDACLELFENKAFSFVSKEPSSTG